MSVTRLPSLAEQKADDTRALPSFRDFSLPGFRDHITELLGMIGHAGIFHTYTRHDITHIDAMLRLLEWIVPQQTQKRMTPADWLLIVLAVYLHDLGMIVTDEEFDRRMENPVYSSWLDRLKRDEADRDYLARTKRMTPDEQERFFFQEYVREGHASRIREWITNSHSRRWSPHFNAAAAEVHRLLSPLPTRFREHLGTVCESHHEDTIDDLERFPLFAAVGSDREHESINVQYAAILLRTADLLHITRDRTPSVMFKLIKFTDPKGVSEWEKQRGTFSVRHRGRKYDPADPTTAEILVEADFTEERPLFALQEYIVYANSQVEQSRRWAEKSQKSDGQDYCFPWSQVTGDVRLEGVRPFKLKFELDRGRLLDLLVGHTLYNDPTVAIRELLQNSIDAVRYQHHLDRREAAVDRRPPEEIGVVKVHWSPVDRKLIVQDNGVGMDKDVIENHLIKVGSSFYNTAKFETEHRDFTPISRFGIGILTCFMISDDIEIVTSRAGKGHRIRMTSVHADYLRREVREHDPLLEGIEPHGTRVTLVLRESVDLSKRSIIDIVRYWIILPECRVEYIEPGKQAEAIGFQTSAEALRYFTKNNDTSEKERIRSTYAKVEFITKNRELTNAMEGPVGSYELAIAVRSGWLPEKSFVYSRQIDSPRVCVEGIRVSNNLPAFGVHEPSDEGMCTLLSVRGNRALRTTVSRSELEQDPASLAVGKLCVKLLVDHVRDEVNRLSSLPGRPLSQASSACKALCRQISKCLGQKIRKDFSAEWDHLPALVLERLDVAATPPQATRELRSRHDLWQLEEFWSVESRLVDSLGVISRDLGRELSLNEFTTALAPDYTQLQRPTLLPDAHVFADDILLSHQPNLVEFSRQLQQTAVCWKACRTQPTRTDFMLSELTIGLGQDDIDSLNEAYRQAEQPRINYHLWVTQIIGDSEPVVDAVSTRFGALLRTGSECAAQWELLREVLSHMLAKKDYPALFQSLIAAEAFAEILLGNRGPISALGGSRYQPERSMVALSQIWRVGLPVLRCALDELQLPGGLPDSITRLRREKVFDASSYWRDWWSVE